MSNKDITPEMCRRSVKMEVLFGQRRMKMYAQRRKRAKTASLYLLSSIGTRVYPSLTAPVLIHISVKLFCPQFL